MAKIQYTKIELSKKGIRVAHEQHKQLEWDQRKIQARDEQVLSYLYQVRMLTLDQIRRLGWAEYAAETTRRRMTKLIKYRLLALARREGVDLKAWGLSARTIYTLHLIGWFWNGIEEITQTRVSRHEVPEFVLHDVLMGELFTRLVESLGWRGKYWTYDWKRQDDSSDPEQLLLPAVLVIVRCQEQVKWAGYVHLYLGQEQEGLYGRSETDVKHAPETGFARLVPESRTDVLIAPWVQLVSAYDKLHQSDWHKKAELAELTHFPDVLVVVRNTTMLDAVRSVIERFRQRRVSYLLTTWDRILQTPDWLTVSVQRSSDLQPKRRQLTALPPATPPPPNPAADNSSG